MDWMRYDRHTALGDGISSTHSGKSGVSSHDFPPPLISQSAVSKMTPVNEEPLATDEPHTTRSAVARSGSCRSYVSAGSLRSSQTTQPDEYELWGAWGSLVDAVKPTTWLRALSAKAQSLAEYWQNFTLFGIHDQRKARALDSAMPCYENGEDLKRQPLSRRRSCGRRRSSCVLSNMVERHAYHDEMRLQLRDERIHLNYLDAFEMDTSAEGHVIRVFSLGAALLEKAKLMLAVWTFFVALIVFSFWTVLNPLHEQTVLLYLDLGIDILYACAIALQVRTSVLDIENGREYCSKDKILIMNVRSFRFWLDIISCIPMVLLEGVFGGVTVRYFALLKILRGWRICRTPPVHHFMPSTSFILVKLATAILMGGHAFACVWFMLVFEMEKTIIHHVPQRNDFIGEFPQAAAYEKCARSSGGCFWELYVVSFNYGIYLLMGIDLDAYSALEHIFVAMCAPLGGLIHAYILGRIILLIQRHGALETRQNEHALEVQQAMRILDLSTDLQMRINAFFTYERIHRSGHSLRALFTALSPQLRFELHLHLYLDLVRKSHLFQKTRPRAIREIVNNLKDVIFLPGDWVCRCGDYGDSMYFMVSGKCVVLDKDAVTEIRMLERGSYFGEISLLTGVPRTAFVRANTFCIMAELTKDSLQPIILKWPEEIEVFISSVEDLDDRERIKAEASRNYKLQKRASFHGYPSSGTDNEAAVGGRSSVFSSAPLAMPRRESRISISSAASSRRSSNESYLRLQEKAWRGDSDGQELVPRLRHSVSGPCCLRRSISSVMSGLPDGEAASNSQTSTAVTFGYLDEFEEKDGEQSSCKGDSQENFEESSESTPPVCAPTKGCLSSTLQDQYRREGQRRSVSFATRQPQALDTNDAINYPPDEVRTADVEPQVGFAQDAETPIGTTRNITGVTRTFQRPRAGSFQESKEKASKNSNRDLTGTPAGNLASRLPTLLATSPNLQAQLHGFYSDVAGLQTEVFKQRELLMASWTDMKQWTVEAVKEVVAKEVSHIVRSGILAERRNSNFSMDSGDYEFGEADTSGGISTPFT